MHWKQSKNLQDGKMRFSKFNKILILFLFTFFVFIMDFILKTIFYNKNSLIFTYLQNRGALFGLFEGYLIGIIISSVLFAVILFLAYLYLNEILKSKFVKKLVKNDKSLKKCNFALILLFAGTVSNLIDRLVYGYVRDYVSIWKFPVFNLADISIFVGAGMLIFLIFDLD